MSNPWLKKNPLMSMWLSGANSVAHAARGKIGAEVDRQSSIVISRVATDIADAWLATAPASKRKNRFPGI
jgi:hypothetical protein